MNIFRLFAEKCATKASDQQPFSSFENSVKHENNSLSPPLSAKLIRFPSKTHRTDVSKVLSMTATEYSSYDEEPDFCFVSVDTGGRIPHTFSAIPFDEDDMSSITMVEDFSPSQNMDDTSLR